MTKVLDRLRAHVTGRDSTPLQNLVFRWASERGKLQRLPFTQEQLLASINDSPCLNRSERACALGWAAKKFQTAKDALEQDGLIESKDVPRGVGRPDTLLILTGKGYEYLWKQKIKPEKLHGSIEHHCAILRLRTLYEGRGYSVKINHPLTPTLILDLLCENEDERGAVEVVNSNNAARDGEKASQLVGKVSWIQLVATTRELFDHYLAKLGPSLGSEAEQKVQVAFLDDLVSSGS